ncbi:hypothetical protein [Scytonema sp. PCC 10023]|uniref:hypothetical protein n=1 Tax=Scytonema sp. PCC 10023 TaxID=1680591 RepID=UPI0039C693F8
MPSESSTLFFGEVYYVDKLDEYQRLGIPEYWIVDDKGDRLGETILVIPNSRQFLFIG